MGDHDVVGYFNGVHALGSLLIANELAENAARRVENIGQSLGQIAERDRRRKQRIEYRIVKQAQRLFEPAAMGPGRAMRGRDVPDLARDELEPLRVKRAAERHLDLLGAIPG